jgi:hypothetical protein
VRGSASLQLLRVLLDLHEPRLRCSKSIPFFFSLFYNTFDSLERWVFMMLCNARPASRGIVFPSSFTVLLGYSFYLGTVSTWVQFLLFKSGNSSE